MKPILVCLLVLGNLIAATTHAKTWSCVVNKQPLSLNSEVTPWNEFIVGTIGVTTFTYTLTAKNDALYLKVDTLVYEHGASIICE